ncbi:MAG: CoA transferase [Frankiales bacterium]|nr:CoA transferase [Frankiales bacterium]
MADAQATSDQPDGPLSGLRVVLLSPTQPGIQAGQLLADFGAEVIHIERPGGSPLRDQPAWPFWARGSRSIELDLRDPADNQVARDLAIGSDVVIETFRPGVADRLGLGYAELSQTNPGLVFASITGFGRTGPYASLQGYEGVIMAKTGVLWQVQNMAGGGRPALPSALYGSFPATQLALQGILAALIEREDSGLGQQVETSVAQGITVHDTFGWYARVIAERFGGGFTQAPLTQGGVPTGGLSFRLLIALTADGHWLQFSQVVDRLFRAMMNMLDLGWMLTDEEWGGAPNFDEQDKREAFWERLLLAVNAKPLAEWQRLFDEDPNVWAETFRRGSEALDHPQTVWNKMVVDIADPERGLVTQPAAVVRMDGTPAQLGVPAPRRDEHGLQLRALATAGPTGKLAEPPTPARAEPVALTAQPAALAGLTVLELGTYYAAPFGATLMADYGARVIKIEEPGGDPMRDMLPFPDVAGIKALLGKQSIAVDIASDAGREIVYDLARNADIVLQSFRAGVAERLGLDAASLQAVNPNLIYLTAPGYGEDGPCGHRPAYAPTIGAAVGLVDRNSNKLITVGQQLDLAAIKRQAVALMSGVMGVGNADGYAAVTAGTALTLGLLARRRGHGAQTMLTTMLSTATHALSEEMVRYPGRGAAPTADDELYGIGPLYRLYEASEGWVFLAAAQQHEWLRLAAALAGSGELAVDLAADSRFDSVSSRQANAAALIEALSAVFRTRSAAEWESLLRTADVAGVEVMTGPVEANFLDEGSVGQLSGFSATCVHPTLDEMPRLAPLVRFSRSATVAGNPCAVGEHTLMILRELGYPEDRISALLAAKVVIDF